MQFPLKKTRFVLIVLGGIFALAVILKIVVPVQHRTILAHETLFRTEIAATPESRQKGLSGRAGLGEREGMLFLFPLADRYPIWMFDMHFPIDIVWIRGRTVVDIAAFVPPPAPGVSSKDLPLYLPRLPADKVLELPAGAAARAGIVIGDALHGI